MQNILMDWDANKGNTKGRIVLIFFRIAQLSYKNIFWKIFLFPYIIFYKFVVEWCWGIELPISSKVGRGFRIFHGHCIVINKSVIIGNYCTVRQATTIGSKNEALNANRTTPEIGNNVDIGANVCIIGSIKIGNNVIIGAGTVVTKDIPSNSIVVGNPARILPKR